MINNVNLPAIPAKRYFTLEEMCNLAKIDAAQFVKWQREGQIFGRGGKYFTRLDLMKIRQLRYADADGFVQGHLDINGKPIISAQEVRSELKKLLVKIEKTLAN